MDRWEIQQKIYSLNYNRDELEEKIIDLNKKKGRIISEANRKERQQKQASEFFIGRRQIASNYKTVAEGNAVNNIIEKYERIYACSNENSVTNELEGVKGLLSKNCEKIEEQVADLQSQISSIDWQISECYSDLRDLESEVM